jgi:aldehyde:ferredoxin oxidoreductase
MAFGYMGKILWVDLSKKKLKDEVLDEKLCRDYIGGYGIGAKILFDRMPVGADPLGPDNILGIVTGPFDGTPALGASRYTVVGKSPLTQGWGDANSGGNFGPYLRYAGYDGVFFTGISDEPVYLLIDNGKAELRDASSLWGKDTFETEDILKAEYGKDAEVCDIGPSGEKMVLFAAVMNNHGRAAGRSGLGAVMGSKRLKAVVVKGGMKVPMADEEKAKQLRREYLPKLGGHITLLRDFGTPGIFNMLAELGDTPTKNWSGQAVIDLPDFKEAIGTDPIMQRQSRKYACYRCPIGCGGHMKEGTGEYKYAEGSHKPEYETMGMFGTNLLNNNVDSIILLNDMCNRYGVDTITAGATIGFIIECYENGVITKKETDGVEITWGNARAIVAMTEKVLKREGIGDILANGPKRAAELIGKGAEEYAMTINGEAAPAHSPKFGIQWAISYKMDATPARHTQGGGPFPPGVVPEYDRMMIKGRAPFQKRASNFNHVINSIGACQFVIGGYPHIDPFVEFVKAITGWSVTVDDLVKTGERISNIRQAFNIREGVNLVEYKMPGRIVGKPPLKAGPLAGITVDEETLYTEYMTEMDWDQKTAKPSKKKLLELGMDDVAAAMWP